MTIEKAIEILKYNKEMCSFNPNTGEEVPMNKECEEELADACGVAIKALEEVEKYQKQKDKDKYKWHDLRKNPDDLPEFEYYGVCIEGFDENLNPYGVYKKHESKKVIALFKNFDTEKNVYIIGRFGKDIYCEDSKTEYYFYALDFDSSDISDVIAWREIEPFKEEGVTNEKET